MILLESVSTSRYGWRERHVGLPLNAGFVGGLQGPRHVLRIHRAAWPVPTSGELNALNAPMFGRFCFGCCLFLECGLFFSFFFVFLFMIAWVLDSRFGFEMIYRYSQ